LSQHNDGGGYCDKGLRMTPVQLAKAVGDLVWCGAQSCAKERRCHGAANRKVSKTEELVPAFNTHGV